MTLMRQTCIMFAMTSQTQERIPAVTLKWRLQMALDAGGISVEEMSSQLDVSRSTVSRWLNGRGAAPKRPFLIQWALATGVSLTWLETGEGGASPSPTGPGQDKPSTTHTGTALDKLTQEKRARARHAGGSSNQQYVAAA